MKVILVETFFTSRLRVARMNTNTPTDAHLYIDQPDASSFLAEITSLGDHKSILANRDIVSKSGVSLIKAGGRINSKVLNKLLSHRLQAPIEKCLSIEDVVTHKSLIDAIMNLVSPTDKNLRNVDLIRPETLEKLKLTVATFPLPDTLAFRLTVMREKRPVLFSHSLQVAGMTFLIKNLMSSSPQDLLDAFTAGLYHDIGMMHIDPANIGTDELLVGDGREFIHSHPLVGKLMLEAEPLIDKAVIRAILEHHERLDGSGYPAGLAENQICELGQILGIAELMTLKMFSDSGIQAPMDISVILRFCDHKFDPRIANISHFILSKVPVTATSTPPIEQQDFIKKMGPIVDSLLAGRTSDLTTVKQKNQDATLMVFIDKQCRSLARSLSSVGMDINNWDNISKQLDLNQQNLVEMNIILNELRYQLRSMLVEIEQRKKRQLPNPDNTPSILQWVEKTNAALN